MQSLQRTRQNYQAHSLPYIIIIKSRKHLQMNNVVPAQFANSSTDFRSLCSASLGKQNSFCQARSDFQLQKTIFNDHRLLKGVEIELNWQNSAKAVISFKALGQFLPIYIAALSQSLLLAHWLTNLSLLIRHVTRATYSFAYLARLLSCLLVLPCLLLCLLALPCLLLLKQSGKPT